jgi:CPA1 family monovalent cation:H+ antiporter
VAGIVLGNQGRRFGLSVKTLEALDTVWEFVAFLATAFVFLVVGFAIPVRSLADVAMPIAWAIAATLIGRAVIVYVLLGGWRLARQRRPANAAAEATNPTAASGPGAPVRRRRKAARPRPDEGSMPLGWLNVVFWSGLRGAVSTALALSLPVDFPDRAALQGITFGVVLFTLLVQATTADVVVERWGRKGPRAAREGSAGGADSATPLEAGPANPTQSSPGAVATVTGAEPGPETAS